MLLESVPAEHCSKDAKDLDLDHDRLPVERALGVQWCVESDTLKFRIIVDDKPPTRRGILSVVSSIYDPLGFVTPTIHAPGQEDTSRSLSCVKKLDGATLSPSSMRAGGKDGSVSSLC